MAAITIWPVYAIETVNLISFLVYIVSTNITLHTCMDVWIARVTMYVYVTWGFGKPNIH